MSETAGQSAAERAPDETVIVSLTDRGRAYLEWLDSLGTTEPTRMRAFAAGAEWGYAAGAAAQAGRVETLAKAALTLCSTIDALDYKTDRFVSAIKDEMNALEELARAALAPDREP